MEAHLRLAHEGETARDERDERGWSQARRVGECVPVASQVSSTEWLVLHNIYLESRREYVSLLEHFPFSQYSARIPYGTGPT